MDRRIGHAAWALIWLTFAGAPAVANPVPPSVRPSPHPSPSPTAGAELYARRSRRLVQAYLRLKLLEMRELDLDRARTVIERRLGPDALLGPSPFPVPSVPGTLR